VHVPSFAARYLRSRQSPLVGFQSGTRPGVGDASRRRLPGLSHLFALERPVPEAINNHSTRRNPEFFSNAFQVRPYARLQETPMVPRGSASRTQRAHRPQGLRGPVGTCDSSFRSKPVSPLIVPLQCPHTRQTGRTLPIGGGSYPSWRGRIGGHPRRAPRTSHGSGPRAHPPRNVPLIVRPTPAPPRCSPRWSVPGRDGALPATGDAGRHPAPRESPPPRPPPPPQHQAAAGAPGELDGARCTAAGR